MPNALEDPRFANSPLVTCDGGVRMYVGVPLKTPGGFNIGALCAIDSKPGTVTPDQINVMQDLARLVVDELELRKLAAVDSLTGAMTGRSFALEAKKEIARARRYNRSLGCIAFDLDHFKSINDTYGHAAGDMVLRAIAAKCQGELRGVDILGRLGGEEFAVILPESGHDGAMMSAERLRTLFATEPVAFAGHSIPVTASFGVAMWDEADGDIANTLKRADAAMYKAKTTGRNRVVSAETAEMTVAAA